jgi:hypothetical protein
LRERVELRLLLRLRLRAVAMAAKVAAVCARPERERGGVQRAQRLDGFSRRPARARSAAAAAAAERVARALGR